MTQNCKILTFKVSCSQFYIFPPKMMTADASNIFWPERTFYDDPTRVTSSKDLIKNI